MKTIFLMMIALSTSTAFADDCGKLAGNWRISDGSGTVIAIASDCKAEFTQIAPGHDSDNLILNSLFYQGTQIRAQYGLKPGTVDDSGQPLPNPLPADMQKQLQGNVFLNADGSLTFRIDFIDKMCTDQSHGGDPLKLCPAPPFVRM